ADRGHPSWRRITPADLRRPPPLPLRRRPLAWPDPLSGRRGVRRALVGGLAGRQVDNRRRVVDAIQAGAHESPRCERFQPLTSTDGDDVLLQRLRAGDEKAFEELVVRYDGALRRVARAFVRTSAAADDVAQETWLAAVRGLK